MSPGSERATAAAVAHDRLPSRLYRRISPKASLINDLLAGLLFSLQGRCVTLQERSVILNTIDDLLRLKIDAGLLTGVPHGT
jgi:hypothetical protein